MTIIGKIDTREIDALNLRILRATQNLNEPLEDIGDMLEASIDENFEAEGRPNKWAPLSPVTINARSKGLPLQDSPGKRWPGKIGQQSGNLVSSISHKVSGDRVTVTHGKEYGDYFNFGTEQNVTLKQALWLSLNLEWSPKIGAKIENPARPFMLIQDDDLREAGEILLDHFREAIRPR